MTQEIIERIREIRAALVGLHRKQLDDLDQLEAILTRKPEHLTRKARGMSKIEVEFKFEIGEIVFFRDAFHGIGKWPNPFVIVERIAQECHGGVQRLYRLNGIPDRFVSEVTIDREEPAFRPRSYAEILDGTRPNHAERKRIRSQFAAEDLGEPDD